MKRQALFGVIHLVNVAFWRQILQLCEDIGGGVAFLCTADARWLNGQRLEAQTGMNSPGAERKKAFPRNRGKAFL